MDFSAETRKKPLCAMSAFSYIPPRRHGPKEMSYYNSESKVTDVSTYDQVFNQAEGYDMRLRRDDRRHEKGRGLNIYQEEKSRPVPVRASSEYGRRSLLTLDRMVQSHARVSLISSEFYMKNGITWTLEEGYGSVVPT